MASGDRIHLRDLRVRAIVGIHPWEREKPQELVINLTLYGDLEKAATTDAIGDTVHYGTLAKAVVAHAQSAGHRLIETLARELARIALEQGAERVVVRIDKPWAVEHAAAASVELERSRADFERLG
jgi:FolB domain-containing protein